MGENIADMAGLLDRARRLHVSLGGKPAPVIDGLTGDQRFFLAFAPGVARQAARRRAARRRSRPTRTARRSSGSIGPLRNLDAWYAAFGITDGQYYLKPEERTRIW